MKTKFIYFAQLLGFIILFYVLSLASIGGLIFPFAFSMLFALAWANQKVWILSPAYIIGTICANPSLETAICSLVAVFVLVLPYFIHVLCKKAMKKWELFLCLLVSQTATITFQAINLVNPILIVVNIATALLFCYVAITFFEPLLLRGTAFKFSNFEIVCAGILLVAFASGLNNFNFYNFSFLKLFAPFIILTFNYIVSARTGILVASLMALGSLIASNNLVYFVPLILWALFAGIFSTKHRIFSIVGVVVAELICGFYFKTYYSYGIVESLPVLIACILFFALPAKWYQEVGALFTSSSQNLAVKNLINRNREILHRRLDNLSEVFFEMNSVFKRLIKSEMSPEQVKEMLYNEIKSTICKNCPDEKHCHRTFCNDTKKVFEEMITIALEKGRITILDLPSYLASRCGKGNMLISEINTLTSQYRNYSQLVGNVDTSKLLISDQLSGVAGLMKDLASEVEPVLTFDNNKEAKLIDELAFNNIACTDAVVYDKDARVMIASLIVRDEDVEKTKLQAVVSKICGNKMAIFESYPSSRAGLTTVNLKTAPRFDCIFGIALQNKSGSSQSGDCHSIERLDGDKFMFAICDGMGSGEQAREKAETAIGLVENFYKAGFDNEIILSSVNKLLNLEKDEMFSTIDICVVDLKSGIADFVKMGATSSFVRKEDGCEILESGALPIGVLQDAKPLVKKIVLSERDFIVISSDGVNDAFGSDKDYRDFLLTIKTTNPQEYAETIIEKALANNNGYAVDDMTCVVVKIF